MRSKLMIILLILLSHVAVLALPDSTNSVAGDSTVCKSEFRTMVLKDSSIVQASYSMNMSCSIFPVRTEAEIITADGRVLEASDIVRYQKADGSWVEPRLYRVLKVTGWVLNGLILLGFIYLIAD